MLTALLVSALALVSVPGYAQPTWSPGGKRIAFVHSTGRGAQGRPTRSEIEVVTLGTSRVKRLTNGDGYNLRPAWSPNGKQIAFVRTSYDGSRESLLLMDASGRRKRILVRGFVSRPSWAPDSRRLAYVSAHSLFTLDVRTRTSRQLGRVPGTEAAWSPGGAEIAIGGDCIVYVVGADGQNRRPAEGVGCVAALYTGPPTWSPDGARIAFSSCRLGQSCTLYETPAATTWPDGSWRLLYCCAGPDPDWSPDGRQIAFTCVSGGRSGIHRIAIPRPAGFAPPCGL